MKNKKQKSDRLKKDDAKGANSNMGYRNYDGKTSEKAVAEDRRYNKYRQPRIT